MSALQFEFRHEHAAVARAIRTRAILVRVLSALTIALYFAFMSLFAFDKAMLGMALAPGLTLCLLLGPGLIVTAILISGAFVLWANFIFDRAMADLAELVPSKQVGSNP